MKAVMQVAVSHVISKAPEVMERGHMYKAFVNKSRMMYINGEAKMFIYWRIQRRYKKRKAQKEAKAK